ncbi:PP2C family protein-serine/threonine phosphatase [Kitasatospora sp. GAS204B]|uniref:PP2C family protein-serine/threonine phosphatase n=1 Tax=unclassified Kitasatospora TaxID=2633591 RepID=UPI0024754377|nr:PP2C family protein-serine/threonine phosphatase [Kitasatospora sp. GAS204B]MDH6119446.1 serine phosphatase RsbU (regulator of sigma subunit) [Kitasatospora sp. GAS204B]
MSDKRPSGAAGTSGGTSGGSSDPAESPGGGDGPPPSLGSLATLLDLPQPAVPGAQSSRAAEAPGGSSGDASGELPDPPAGRALGVPAGEVPGEPGSLLDQLPPPERLAALEQLHRHTERLARARGLAATLATLLDSGGDLLGARRALLVPVAREGGESRPPADRPTPAADSLSPAAVRGPAGAAWQDHAGHGPMVGLALDHCAIGALETVPVDHGPFAGLLRTTGRPRQLLHRDLTATVPEVAPRFREVAADLGLGACFALPVATEQDGPLAAAVWFYPTAGQPTELQQELARSYLAFAAPLLAGRLAAERGRRATEALRRGLLPDHLPYLPGLRLAARWLPAGLEHASGSDWYDAIALPDGSIGLTVGSVSGDGPGAGPASATGAASAMGRLRAALRAYAVLEGEDPVAVLGDLELLLKACEPARTATAVYACLDPVERRITLAGAGHCPPLLVTRYGANFVETSLSAPLGMLSCWEAPGVELNAERGDLLLLYTEGLARRCGATLHAGQARLRKAAADAPREVRHDPERLCAHLLDCCADGPGEATDDLVLLAARFE